MNNEIITLLLWCNTFINLLLISLLVVVLVGVIIGLYKRKKKINNVQKYRKN